LKTAPLDNSLRSCRLTRHAALPRQSQTRRFLQLSVSLPLISLLSLATGCSSYMTSKHKLPIPVAPAIVKTASATELVDQINQNWAKFESMTATVDISASHSKTKEGEATDYPTFHAILLLRKPGMLRMLGKVPILQTTMFDLVSDGTRFTFVVPPRKKAYQGLDAVKGHSPVWYENLRPGFLFSAMYVSGLAQDDLFSVTSETITEEDATDKHLLLMPEYELSILRPLPGTQELSPVRVVRFHREDLLPYQQDLYDEKGNLETQVIYGPYKNFAGTLFPSTITLKRPQEEYTLVMTVDQVTANPQLKDDQFQTKIPEGVIPLQMN
jgi:outer membrane lipoprotein-sorting protein